MIYLHGVQTKADAIYRYALIAVRQIVSGLVAGVLKSE